uniref:Uncharacterized protein n=1 Tax=Ciona savignyi TaxID=51511 RepID=H2ZKE1_CIOSA
MDVRLGGKSRDINSNMFTTFQALLDGVKAEKTTQSLKKQLKTNLEKKPPEHLDLVDSVAVIDLADENADTTPLATVYSPSKLKVLKPVSGAVCIPNVEGASVTFSQGDGAAVASWGEESEKEEKSNRVSLRPRRVRQMPKRGYLNDPQYETDFSIDWDEFGFDDPDIFPSEDCGTFEDPHSMGKPHHRKPFS